MNKKETIIFGLEMFKYMEKPMFERDSKEVLRQESWVEFEVLRQDSLTLSVWEGNKEG